MAKFAPRMHVVRFKSASRDRKTAALALNDLQAAASHDQMASIRVSPNLRSTVCPVGRSHC